MLTIFLFLQEQTQKVARNTAEAFSELYREFLPKVFRYISFRIADVNMAEDLTSTVFEKALVKFTSYSSKKAAFSTWIFSIARNTLIDHYRARSKEPDLPIESAALVHDTDPLPEDSAVRKEELQKLRLCLAGLSREEQEIISLKFGGEMTNRQIAGMLGLSESNVGVIIYRSVRKLRDDFKEWGNG